MMSNVPAAYSISENRIAMGETTTTSIFLQPRCSLVASRETDSVFFQRTHDAINTRESDREKKMMIALESSLQENTGKLVKYIWYRLKNNIPGVIGLRVPVLDILDNGVMLTWDHGNYHLDAEVYLDEPIEFFFRNRQTGEIWNREFAATEKLPEDFLFYLSYFRL